MKNRFLPFVLVLSFVLLALASPAPASPASAGAAARNKKAGAAKKAAATKPQPGIVSIPFSLFQSTADLKVGGVVKWTATDGNHYGGTIKSLGKGLVTVKLEPQKVSRREVPFSVFQSTAGAKVGTPVTLTIDGQIVTGTVIAIGKDTLTVESLLP